MNESLRDPWEARLSAYLDGELGESERHELERHLETCAACARAVADLRRIVRDARALTDREPERDLWPAIAPRLESEPTVDSGTRSVSLAKRVAAVVALAAALVLAFFLGKGTIPRAGEVSNDARPRFVLLLHEPAGLNADASAEEIARIVSEYRDWGASVARSGRLEGGEKLADREGYEMRPDVLAARGDVAGIGGFFLIRAHDYDEALEIARGCPHLRHGGWIEVRRIEET